MARDLVDYLTATRELRGSDLHISVDAVPAARVDGVLVPLEDTPFDARTCRDLIQAVLTETQRAALERDWELDFALKVADVGRFRGNAHYSRGNVEAAFRFIPSEVPELAALGHSPIVEEFCAARQGLILVTGMAGTGKSTTLASMTNRILRDRSGVVTTVEDPIEFTYEHSAGIIKQRQIGHDTRSFASALRSAVRQDVNVIVVSEMRDQESIAAALTAAETGHLVISTLHTRNSTGALDRIVDIFPAQQQPQIMTQLAGSLVGIIAQRLLPRQDESGRVMASEVMVVTAGIAAAIRDHRFEQVFGLMQVGAVYGMHTFDDSLLHLLKNGHISLEDAMSNAADPEMIKADFQTYLRAQERNAR